MAFVQRRLERSETVTILDDPLLRAPGRWLVWTGFFTRSQQQAPSRIQDGGRRLRKHLCFWFSLGLGLWLVPSWSAAQTRPIVYDVISPTIERDVELFADGSSLRVGNFGGATLDCQRGTRGFVQGMSSDGEVQWTLSHGGVTDAVCAVGEAAADELFSGWLPPAAHLLASRVFDVSVDPITRRVAVTGDARVAWVDASGDVVSGQTGFLIVLEMPVLNVPDEESMGATVVASSFFGATPQGAPPISTDCLVLCIPVGDDPPGDFPGNLEVSQYGGRAVVWLDGDLVVTGWAQLGAGASRGPFLARLGGGDLQLQWQHFADTGLDGAGLAVFHDLNDSLYVTGFAGSPRDAWIARYASPDGQLLATFQTGGSLDDVGWGISRDSTGIRVDGGFNGTLTVGSIALGEPLGGLLGFTAWFDDQLNPQSATVRLEDSEPLLSAGNSGSPAAPPGPSLVTFDAESYAVMTGFKAGGGLNQLESPDGSTMRLVADGESSSIDFRLRFRPGYAPVTLSQLRLDLSVSRCAAVSVTISREGDEASHQLLSHRLCAESDQVVAYDIPPALSSELGFDVGVPPDPSAHLLVDLNFAFVATPDSLLNPRPEPDASVDQLDLDIDP